MEQSPYADNQQVSLLDIGWLAGIIDGEGCITINKRKQPRCRQQGVIPLITIVNTDPALIENCERILKENGFAYHVRTHPPKEKWKRRIEITISGYKRTTRFVKFIEPYLIAKRQRAKWLIDLCDSRLKVVSGTQYSDHERTLCRSIWGANGRGTTHHWANE